MSAPYGAASCGTDREAPLRGQGQDPLRGLEAAARIVIKDSHGRVVKTIKKSVKTGVGSTASFRCRLARGKYRYYVCATDPAGNTQVKIVSNRLTVR